MKNNQKIQKALSYLRETHNAEYCSLYGEPGYSEPAQGVILANWNYIPNGLADWLEKCGFALEWCDEWMIDYGNNKAYRTIPDCYSWESSIMLPAESCEYITPDDSTSVWIEACQITSNCQPIQRLPSWVACDDILSAGFELYQADFEYGLHPGQTDNPQEIARERFTAGAYRVLFQRSENSQFYTRFRVWVDMQGESDND